ncbi:MAG: hypothetical protein GXP03_03115 [Alphaproteobacteria bacterium]|nr:hypothetical protein [Alphaproteobacteria bacterium]
MSIRPLLLAIVIASASAFPSLAQESDLVGRLVGVWVGEGTVRPRGFDAPEKIRCKVKGERMADFQVRFAGRCATTSGAAAFRLRVAQDQAGQVFAAKIRLSSTEADVDFKGPRTGEGMVLAQIEPLEQGARLLASEILLMLPLNGDIRMTNDVTDQNSGEQAQSLDIRFVRQK